MAARHSSRPWARTRAVLTEQSQPSSKRGEQSTTTTPLQSARRSWSMGPGRPRSSTPPSQGEQASGREASL
eukprot:12757435-Alexandrium_andersonii.AAC.1